MNTASIIIGWGVLLLIGGGCVQQRYPDIKMSPSEQITNDTRELTPAQEASHTVYVESQGAMTQEYTSLLVGRWLDAESHLFLEFHDDMTWSDGIMTHGELARGNDGVWYLGDGDTLLLEDGRSGEIIYEYTIHDITDALLQVTEGGVTNIFTRHP